MGLFGGFKAKFTKNASTKSKPQDVVCLRYHIHSEFDADSSESFTQINNGIKKSEVAHGNSKNKKRKAVTKSAIFPENNTSPSQSSNTTPQKSLSLTNLHNDIPSVPNRKEKRNAQLTDPITISTTLTLPSNGKGIAVSDTKFKKTTEEHNGVVTEKVAVVNDKHVYTTDHDIRKEQHTQSILKKKSTYNEEGALSESKEYMSNTEMSYVKPSSTYENSVKENGLNDQSTLIFMTQHGSRSSSFDNNMGSDNTHFTNSDRYLNNTMDEKKISIRSDEDAEYFKVNVMKHSLSRTYSCSDDEQSHVEEDEPLQFTRMGYSSQAASIFFGEGEETEVTRPRQIQLMNDDDDDDRRRSSGADC